MAIRKKTSTTRLPQSLQQQIEEATGEQFMAETQSEILKIIQPTTIHRITVTNVQARGRRRENRIVMLKN